MFVKDIMFETICDKTQNEKTMEEFLGFTQSRKKIEPFLKEPEPNGSFFNAYSDTNDEGTFIVNNKNNIEENGNIPDFEDSLDKTIMHVLDDSHQQVFE